MENGVNRVNAGSHACLLRSARICYTVLMTKTQIKDAELADHLRPGEVENPDPDYQAWKERKILRALEQSKDRSAMIPAEEVWKDLGQ